MNVLGHPRIGPRYIQAILEPTLQAVKARFAAHIAAGEMRDAGAHHAALALLAPVILALLHQGELGRAKCHPLDLEAFVEDHAAAFIRTWEIKEGVRMANSHGRQLAS